MPSIAILRPASRFPPTLGLVHTDPSDPDLDPLMLRIGGATVFDRVIARVRPQCSGLCQCSPDRGALSDRLESPGLEGGPHSCSRRWMRVDEEHARHRSDRPGWDQSGANPPALAG